MTNSKKQERSENNQYSPQANDFTKKLAKILVMQIKSDLEQKRNNLKISHAGVSA